MLGRMPLQLPFQRGSIRLEDAMILNAGREALISLGKRLIGAYIYFSDRSSSG
jgi:hypothetical protein